MPHGQLSKQHYSLVPPTGEYLLTNTGFSHDQPVISLSRDGVFYDFSPLDQAITLKFSTTQRFCVGWRDITTGDRSVCPDRQAVDSKYEQCAACQQRTGFNPAFYHAASVSPQQEARNLQPHILYLAYFGGDIIKVGISHAARGNNRLLEQGARAALVLDTFPTAHIARQYEAKIAAMPGIAETVATRQKIAALTNVCDGQKLEQTRQRIEAQLGVSFNAADIAQQDLTFFPSGLPKFDEAFDTTSQAIISGWTLGMLGSLLFTTQQETPLFIAIKKFVGYQLHLSFDQTTISLPARQIPLFS